MFTLRFPFKLLGDHELQIPKGHKHTKDNISIEPSGVKGGYALSVSGFQNVESAKDYLDKIRLSFQKLLLERGISTEKSFEIEDLHKVSRKSPECLSEFDHIAGGHCPTLFPENIRVGHITMGDCSSTTAHSAQVIVDYIENSVSVVLDSKLTLALDLYASFFLESSPRSKFLTLITILEVLAETADREECVLQLLDRWKKDIDEKLKNQNLNGDEKSALEILRGDILFKKQESIKSSIRKLIKAVFVDDPSINIDDKVKVVGNLYDMRSRLTHDGQIDNINEHLTNANEIVKKLLKIRLQRKVSECPI